jgi:UDP-N-acetylglucosamine 2-epimerase
MPDIFFEELNIPHPYFNIEVGSGSHTVQTGKMLEGIETNLFEEEPNKPPVFCNINSTLIVMHDAKKCGNEDFIYYN